MVGAAHPTAKWPPMSEIPLPQFAAHPRTYHENKFVYPVLSRRSGGISIGVNLNPDKICNFDCIYCQVDRRSAERNAVRRNRRAARRTATTCSTWSRPATSTNAEKFRDVAAAPAPAQRHRLLRRRRADDVQELRRDHRAPCAELKRQPRPRPPSRWSSSPTPACSTARTSQRGLAILDAQQRRNLGQARSRHRRVLPPHRAHADSVPADSGQHHGRRAQCGRW